MSNIFKLWFFHYPLGLGFAKIFGGPVPTSREVSRELHKILGDDFLKFLNRINLDLESFIKMTRAPVMIIVIIALILGLFFLFRSLAPYIRNDSNRFRFSPDAALRRLNQASGNVAVLFQQALDQSGAGDYSQAIVSLHKATVEYLTTKVITSSSSKKYSNNDFKRKLKEDSNLYRPFTLIANYAEIAGFSATALSQGDFAKALETFKKYFL